MATLISLTVVMMSQHIWISYLKYIIFVNYISLKLELDKINVQSFLMFLFGNKIQNCNVTSYAAYLNFKIHSNMHCQKQFCFDFEHITSRRLIPDDLARSSIPEEFLAMPIHSCNILIINTTHNSCKPQASSTTLDLQEKKWQ